MIFWQGFLVLSVVAALFILWPTIVVHLKRRKQELMLQNRSEINEVVYKDQLSELEATHGRGEIEASELQMLKDDLEKTHIYESAQLTEPDRPIVANWRSRIPVICLALAVPLVTLLIYFQVGAKQDWDIYQMRTDFVHSEDRDEALALGNKLVKALQNRLEDKPQNGHNWYLLGRTAIDVGDYEEAVRAYRKLHELEPSSAQVLAELTQALFRWAGTITPEVRVYIQRTLALQEDVPSILGLAGIDAFQNGKYQEAIDYWTRAVNRLNPHSSDYQVLTNGIAQAKAALNGAGGAQVAETQAETTTPKSVSVRVSLAEGVEVDPESTVFVYARAWQGPRVPLAIQRLKVTDLPSTVKLDESMAMDPNRSLATAPQVEIVARVSKSGNAVAQPGDWEGAVGPVVPGSPGKRVKLVIENQIEQ